MPIDYSHYHPKWSLIRRLILKRAGHRCEECGVENYEMGFRIRGRFYSEITIVEILEKTGFDLTDELSAKQQERPLKIILTVAHVDHDVGNNRFSNLRAWCQRCHLNHDRVDNAHRRRYGKHNHRIQMTLFQH